MLARLQRWIRALGYLITGQPGAAGRALRSGPGQDLEASYEEVIRTKASQVDQYQRAVAQILAAQADRVARARKLSGEIDRLERLRAGALAKANRRAEKLGSDGRSPAEVQTDATYQECSADYARFCADWSEKQAATEELEREIEEHRRSTRVGQANLRTLLRELERLKQESAEAESERLASQGERVAAATLKGLDDDSIEEELERLRALRDRLRAETRVARDTAADSSRPSDAQSALLGLAVGDDPPREDCS